MFSVNAAHQHVHAVFFFRGAGHAHVIRVNGQLAVAAINQNQQLHLARPAEIRQGLQGGPDGAAGIQDIVHQHPNCDPAAYGKTSYLDFLRFAHAVEGLEHGVVMNFGSAVMAPEVFLKALSMARNVAGGQGREIRRFTSLVCDLHDLPESCGQEAPKGTPGYFFRPWKTMLVRTVADGGEGHYVRGEHRRTIPALWTAINTLEGRHA